MMNITRRSALVIAFWLPLGSAVAGGDSILSRQITSYRNDQAYFANLAMAFNQTVESFRARPKKDEFETDEEYIVRQVEATRQLKAKQTMWLRSLYALERSFSSIPVHFPKYDIDYEEFDAIVWTFSTAASDRGLQHGPPIQLASRVRSIVVSADHKFLNGGAIDKYDCMVKLTVQLPSDKARKLKHDVDPKNDPGRAGEPVHLSNLDLTLIFRIEDRVDIFSVVIVGARLSVARTGKVVYEIRGNPEE
jgi:hypothetical protein